MNCPSCGTEAKPNVKFCTSCGFRLAGEGAKKLEATQPAAPATVTPRAPAAPVAPSTPAAPAEQPPQSAPRQAGLPRIDDLRPRLVPVVSRQVSEKTLVLKNAEKRTYIEIGAEDASYLQYLDGRHTVSEILKEMFEKTGQMSFKRLYNLLVELYINDFLYIEGLEALDAAAGGGAARASRGPLSRLAAALERVEVQLPPLGALIKALSVPMSLLMSLPAQIAIFALCVLPVMIAGFLASPYANFMRAAADRLYSVAGLFAAPSQKGYNIFMFHGSYLYGLLFIYLAAFCVLSFRSISRGATLHHFGCEVYRPALRVYYGMFYLDVDGRDIAMADRHGRMVYHAAGITSTLIIGTIINVAQHFLGFSHPLYLIYITAYAITFVNFCVFFRSDLFLLLDDYFELPHLRKHAGSYVRKKFFQQVLSFRSSFPEERALTTIACLGILWLYLAISVFFDFLRENLAFLVNGFGDSKSIATKIVIGFIIINVAAPFAIILASLAAVVFRNLGAMIGAPVGRMTRRFASRRGRYRVEPTEVAGFLARIPLFAGLSDDERLQVGERMAQVGFRPGQNVVVQGDRGAAFYVILEGAADIIIESPSGLRTTIDTLRAGDSFGEIALLEVVPRTATVRAVEPLTVLELDKPYFDEFVEHAGGLKERITEVIRLTALLRKIPFFREMAPSQITEIISRLRHEYFQKGQAVIREGSAGNRFYIIASGDFRVVKNAPGGQPQTIAKLGRNEWFGEIALLHNVPRTSSVVAETDGHLLSLSREEFLSAANASIKAGLVLEDETERRLAELKRRKG